jgi:hypothetical protein
VKSAESSRNSFSKHIDRIIRIRALQTVWTDPDVTLPTRRIVMFKNI